MEETRVKIEENDENVATGNAPPNTVTTVDDAAQNPSIDEKWIEKKKIISEQRRLASQARYKKAAAKKQKNKEIGQRLTMQRLAKAQLQRDLATAMTTFLAVASVQQQ